MVQTRNARAVDHYCHITWWERVCSVLSLHDPLTQILPSPPPFHRSLSLSSSLLRYARGALALCPVDQEREEGRRGNKRALSARITRLLEIARFSELQPRLRDVGPVVPTLTRSPPASSYSFPCRPPRMTDQPNQTSQIHQPTFGGDNSSLFAITRKPRSEGGERCRKARED